MKVVGREVELKILSHCLRASESKLIAMYGRRRVGKTFLIRKALKDKTIFEITALHKGDMEDQLEHFANVLVKHGYYPAGVAKPTTWMAAFDLLTEYLNGLKGKRKKVVFFDELPWFDTPRSKFLMAFENFWNSYCTKREDLVVVICGSAASWMIKKILKNRGGLHNRVSERIKLKPFTLYETEQFLQIKGIKWSRYDIIQAYMVTGGVPFYLDAIRKGESMAQFVDRTCFTESGVLSSEFEELFSSLFKQSEIHEMVVEQLSTKRIGLMRNELIKSSGLTSGGTLTKVLNELDESGFITKFTSYTANKTKVLYRLTDQFTMFYLKFIKGQKVQENLNPKLSWIVRSQSQSWISWSGFAFEAICFQHIKQIKKALSLEAIHTEISNWQGSHNGDGAQIDLIIDRADRIVNVCEIKFSKNDFTIDKTYARNLRNKLEVFSNQPKNKRKSLFLTMITPFGVKPNEYQSELVQNEVDMDDFFVQ